MAPAPPRPPDERAHEVLEGEVAAVVFQNEETGFAVVALDTGAGTTETAAGPLAPVHEGQRLRLHGRHTVHPRFGRQFQAAWSEVETPTTRAGLERYLASGAFPGIGADVARKLVEHFGDQTLEALEAGPERLREAPGIGEKRARVLAEAFAEGAHRHRVLAELRGLGLQPAQALALYERWQAGAVERVRKDPYDLIGRVSGVGYQTAERIASALGLEPTHPVRIRGLVLHRLRSAATEGHVFLPRPALEEDLRERGIGAGPLGEALETLAEQGRVVVEEERIYLGALWQAETDLAAGLQRLFAPNPTPLAPPEVVLAALRRAEYPPDPSQRAALEMALKEPVAVVTGGPGTGKTTTLRLLLDILESAGVGPVRLASPTGRAARRLREATGREASTVHRLLGFEPHSGQFRHGEEDPLEAAYVVVDEVSMMDLHLAASLVAALPDGCRLLLVGDAAQLPSVGPGSVLRDLVRSRTVPTSRLERIHRQGEGSAITEAAWRILRGEMPASRETGGSGDFFVVRRDEAREAAALVERLLVERIPRRYGIQPEDTLVLSPMYGGPLGVDALNERLSARLNPDGKGESWTRGLRQGDRVLVVRNDYEREVFNGDRGRVIEVFRDHLVVEIDGRAHEYSPEQLGDLIPAWCVTVHRAQGSEARAVVLVLSRSHWMMLRRNLVYTAVTRGKELVVVVTDRTALPRAVRNSAELERHSWLRERLDGAPARRGKGREESGTGAER